MATWSDRSNRSRRAVTALDEAAPTLDTDGVDLRGLVSIRPWVSVPSALVSGIMRGFFLVGGIWEPDETADYDLSLKAGLLTALLPVYNVRSARDRFMLLPTGVVLGGAGSQLTIDYWCVFHPNLGVPA